MNINNNTSTNTTTFFIYIFINFVLILFVLLSKFKFNYNLTFIHWLLLYTLLFLFAYIYNCITTSSLSLDFFKNINNNTIDQFDNTYTFPMNSDSTNTDTTIKNVLSTTDNITTIRTNNIDKRIISNNLYDYNQQRLDIQIPPWDIHSFRDSICKDMPTYNCKLNSINCATRENIIK